METTLTFSHPPPTPSATQRNQCHLHVWSHSLHLHSRVRISHPHPNNLVLSSKSSTEAFPSLFYFIFSSHTFFPPHPHSHQAHHLHLSNQMKTELNHSIRIETPLEVHSTWRHPSIGRTHTIPHSNPYLHRLKQKFTYTSASHRPIWLECHPQPIEKTKTHQQTITISPPTCTIRLPLFSLIITWNQCHPTTGSRSQSPHCSSSSPRQHMLHLFVQNDRLCPSTPRALTVWAPSAIDLALPSTQSDSMP